MTSDNPSTTGIKSLEDLLLSVPDGSEVAYVYIIGTNGETGHNEDINFCVHACFKELATYPEIRGLRTGWFESIYVSNTTEKMCSRVVLATSSPISDKVEMRALCDKLQGSSDERIKTVQKLELQLNKINYWQTHMFDHYFKNGQRHELAT